MIDYFSLFSSYVAGLKDGVLVNLLSLDIRIRGCCIIDVSNSILPSESPTFSVASLLLDKQ